jgi:Zn-dependent protease with chaperone function
VTTAIPAFYFDGRTSRRYRVELSVRAGIAIISGELERECPLSALRVSERSRHAARKLSFPDGAYAEIGDNAAFARLLQATGHREPLVARLQQSWRLTTGALLATIAILVVGYLYGLPAASRAVAHALPEEVERTIGGETLAFLDRRLLAPSTLPARRQEAIAARFKSLAPPRDGVPGYRLIFRKSRIGPNAFALPSGHIVLTDDIVALMDDDDAVMGILAHELGHLHERHLLRRMIEGTVIGIGATALFGDVSAVIANIPTLMLDLKYSRDAEREADAYAVAMLKANGIAPAKMALVFTRLDQDGRQSGKAMPYLSSHPASSERIDHILGRER